MEKVNQILRNQLYIECIEKNGLYEQDRSFCRHDMGHFLDVARIAMILNLEEEIKLDKETIYAAALLHDVARYRQYEDGTPHQEAGAVIARQIMQECGFAEAESEQIADAIWNHRNKAIQLEFNLRGVLYRADKASRACYNCKASQECDWKQDKKNTQLMI